MRFRYIATKKKDSSFFIAWNSLDSDIETIKVHADEMYGEESASFKLHFWAWDSHKLKTTYTLYFNHVLKAKKRKKCVTHEKGYSLSYHATLDLQSQHHETSMWHMCILCSLNREAEQPKNQQVICNPITLLYGKSTCIITLHE